MAEAKALERNQINFTVLARAISIASTPGITGGLFLAYALYALSPTAEIFLKSLFIVFFFSIFLPAVFTFYLLKKEKIGNFHIKERRERTIPFAFALISSTGSLLIIKYLGINHELIKMLIIFYLMALGFVAITSWRYKISGHIFIFFSSVLSLSFFLGREFAYLLLLAIPIAWARVYTKEHTWGEVLGAVGYSLVSFIFFTLLINT